MSDTNFYATVFDGADLTGVTWTADSCPDNTLSSVDGGTCLGHLTTP